MKGLFDILQSIFSGNIVEILMSLLAGIVVVFTALPIHEVAHGYIANKLGDPTAKNLGRLNLNPFVHFDLIGTTALLLLGYGWAKPVPVNPFYFKNRKNGMALTALAGPVANILLAMVALIIYKLLGYFAPSIDFISILMQVLSLIMSIDLSLAAFNLLPIPPLDGSKIIGLFMPMNVYARFENFLARYQHLVMYGLMAVFFVLPYLSRMGGVFSMIGNLFYIPLDWIRQGLFWLINFLTGFIDIIAKAVL